MIYTKDTNNARMDGLWQNQKCFLRFSDLNSLSMVQKGRTNNVVIKDTAE